MVDLEEIRKRYEGQGVPIPSNPNEDIRALLSALDAKTAEVERLTKELQPRLDAEKAAKDQYDWVIGVCANPPEPNEKLKALFRAYKGHPALKASGTFSDGVEAAAKYIEDCHDYGWEGLAAAIRALAKGE